MQQTKKLLTLCTLIYVGAKMNKSQKLKILKKSYFDFWYNQTLEEGEGHNYAMTFADDQVNTLGMDDDYELKKQAIINGTFKEDFGKTFEEMYEGC